MKSQNIHLCIIRLSAMGDVAMTVPVIHHLVSNYPEIKITVVSKPHLKAVFENIPQVAFFGADVNGAHKGLRGLFKLYKSLKNKRITHFIDLHNVLRTKVLCLFFKFGKIKVHQLNKGRREKKKLVKTKQRTMLLSTHERYADVFRKAGFKLKLSQKDCISISGSKSNRVQDFIKIHLNNTIVGIAPFAQYKSKTYPESQMLSLIQLIADKTNFSVFLFGGGAIEKELLEKWAKPYDNVISVAGRFSLREELELIAHLKAMISMDSGNGHFSAMLGVPTITLWGTTHPSAGFKPFAQPDSNSLIPNLEKYPLIPLSIYGNKMIEGYENVMDDISPDSIINRLNQVLMTSKE